jgi:uncharacterized protein YjbI with pentapeptide repeats
MPRGRKQISAVVAPPEFPDTMPQAPEAAPELADRVQLSQRVWVAAHCDQQRAEDVLLECIQSRNGSYQQVELPLLQCSDSQFEHDDFAGAVLEKPYLRRVSFGGCRLMGLAITDGDLQDVLLRRCQLDMARVWTTRCVAVQFDHCTLREASFDGSDLSGVVLRNCDLTGADLRNTRLRGADLRGSTIEGLRVRSQDLAGAIVDPQQAVALIELFGVVVRPVPPAGPSEDG